MRTSSGQSTTPPASVPPPGWTPSDLTPAAPAPAAAAFSPGLAPGAADAAVRWRISAAITRRGHRQRRYVVFCAGLEWRVTAPTHVLALVAGGIAYHFLLESRDGQTIGERRYGLRVLSRDGGRATTRAIATRSALRIIDQLPVYYVSGLVSMVRTGAARRRRIGDVAGGTMVVAEDRLSAARGTPGWILPAATIVAVLLSAVSPTR